MERIILVTGGNREVITKGVTKSVAKVDSSAGSPFWLDLLSPSERVLNRLAVGFRFEAKALKSCLSWQRSTGCDDFGNHIFIAACLLEPSKRHLFIQSGVKIFLNNSYLITIHKRRRPIARLAASLQASAFHRTGTLLLAILDPFIGRLTKSVCGERNIQDFRAVLGKLNKSSLWWQLRNLEKALIRQSNLLEEIAFVGARFFDRRDMDTFRSLRAKHCFLSATARALLSSVDISENNACHASRDNPRGKRRSSRGFRRGGSES